ncbi:protein tumorous imaginal discs, mitochondrial-like isoform X2 [Gordionus sp. m RMFG-2023]|uniref:protein tumorous imaginal discs, mitochondrial-like isoform X2 n=1 Tax=Gordionus sp. m RMFG-2023 TaxID=3053472 RepID=UPI0031FCA31E
MLSCRIKIYDKKVYDILSLIVSNVYTKAHERIFLNNINFNSSFSYQIRNFRSSTRLLKKDFYKILGVPNNALERDIKKAYYDLAKKYHPDTNNDAKAKIKFQEVSEAYEILSDKSKRQQYDQWGSATDFGSTDTHNTNNETYPGFDFSQFHSNVDPEELFRKIFGNFGNAGTGNQQRGFSFSDFSDSIFGHDASNEVTLNLTFQQAARGVNQEIYINILDTCPKCKGSKSEPGFKSITCPYCNGSGMETINTGPFVMRSTCRKCYGTTKFTSYPCKECSGKGQNLQRKKVMIPVPAGVEDGQTLRMNIGKKEVFINFKVAKSDYFKREGADVHTDTMISVSQAILGGVTRIQGIYEDIDLKIPAGTSSGQTIRIPKKGMPRVHSYGMGDHYVHVHIKIPTRLSAQQKALIRAYAEIESDTPGTIKDFTKTKTDVYWSISICAYRYLADFKDHHV